jgi:hypothetical protein
VLAGEEVQIGLKDCNILMQDSSKLQAQIKKIVQLPPKRFLSTKLFKSFLQLDKPQIIHH